MKLLIGLLAFSEGQSFTKIDLRENNYKENFQKGAFSILILENLYG